MQIFCKYGPMYQAWNYVFVILDFVCSNLFQINNFIKFEYVQYSHVHSYSAKWKDF